jgi:hypothetical protein
VTLKRPVTNEKLLQVIIKYIFSPRKFLILSYYHKKLETVKDEELRPQFLEEVSQFLSMVRGMLEPKQLYGEHLSGRSTFCGLKGLSGLNIFSQCLATWQMHTLQPSIREESQLSGTHGTMF